LRSENLPYDIDVWYPGIERWGRGRGEEVTFRTVFIPLLRVEAESAVHFFRTLHNIKRERDFGSEDGRVLSNLQQRVDKVVRKEFRQSGAMVRLCGRSPKDGTPRNSKLIREKYQAELEYLRRKRPGKIEGPDLQMAAISRCTETLRVLGGEDVMHLLLSSERVYADLIDWLEYGEPEQIVLRQWCQELSLDYEFRLYCRQGKLIGISQYDTYGTYPYLADQRASLEALLVAFWEEVHDAVGVSSYCMDVGVLPRSADADLRLRETLLPGEVRCVLIELSPFLPCTGPALFRWHDGELHRGGATDLLVVRTAPLPSLGDLIEHNWERRWAAAEEVGPVPPFSGSLPGLLGRRLPSRSPNDMSLFVYGTLRKGYFWHNKFLWTAKYAGEARTVEPYPLVVGECGVPYVLLGEVGLGVSGATTIRGEMFRVSSETMKSLDEYEGVGKGYYKRVEVMVVVGKRTERCFMFGLHTSLDGLSTDCVVSEYTKVLHEKLYQPIRHIELKQHRYLSIPTDVAS